jgi:hypothetical protein
MSDLQTVVLDLLNDGPRTQRDLADLVPCSPSQIAMLATGARGKQTTYRIEHRLRELHAAALDGQAK